MIYKLYNASNEKMTQPNTFDKEEFDNHPFVKLLANLNMTECYKHMLIGGDESIASLAHINVSEYKKLHADFAQKYPEAVKYCEEKEPNDCTIM